LVETDPGRTELVAVLPPKAGRLHDTADDGGVEQFLEGSRRDLVSLASGRRMAEFAGEKEVSRAVKLRQLVELVGIKVAEVDLSPRSQRMRLTGFGLASVEKLFRISIRFLLSIPTAITTRGHFFCGKKSSQAALMKSSLPMVV